MNVKLALDNFLPVYTHGINKSTVLFNFHQFLSGKFDYKLDFNVYLKSKGIDLQRPLCWTQIQKEQLVLSMLKGIKLPVFTCVQHEDAHRKTTLFVIDGKQRFNTIFEFLRGEFAIPFKNEHYFFQDLEVRAQREIEWAYPTWDIHYSYYDDPIKDETMIQIFEQVNFLGTPQDVKHLKKLKES